MNIKRAIITFAIAYTFLLIAIFLMQERLIFPRHLAPADATVNSNVKEHFLTVKDGTKLQGTIYYSNNPNAPLIIGFAGNAWNAVNLTNILSEGLGEFNIISFNYRGYGESEGSPTEKDLFSDALEIYNFAKSEFKNSKIYILGASLGSGVASYLASEKESSGVILLTPFDSVAKVAQSQYFYLPAEYLTKHKFESFKYVKDISAPILVGIVKGDFVINNSRTENLLKHIDTLAGSFTLEGTIHDGILYQPKTFYEIKQFINTN